MARCRPWVRHVVVSVAFSAQRAPCQLGLIMLTLVNNCCSNSPWTLLTAAFCEASLLEVSRELLYYQGFSAYADSQSEIPFVTNYNERAPPSNAILNLHAS